MAFKDTGLSAESELLLCCARTHMHAQTLERIADLIQEPIDWQRLTRAAVAHGVLPLLYSNLRKTGFEAIPKPSLDVLRNHFRANVQHSFFLTAELLKLLKVFETHGIKAIPFKGPVLAASAYGDVTLRQFSDLDILVHKQNILEAARLIIAQGYESGSTGDNVSDDDIDHEEVAFRGPKFYTFWRPDGRSRVDLQWRITEQYFSFSLDKESLWRRLATVSLAGKMVLTFAPTDMLLILCVHGSKHRWEKLKWVCDVAELVRAHQETIDWEEVRREAGKQGVERMLELGLFLAHDLLKAAVPEEISRRLQGNVRNKWLAQEIRERLFIQAGQHLGDIQRILFYLRTKDHWRARAQFCFRYVSQCFQAVVTPSPIERDILPLPVYLSFLYFFIRPVRLLGKYAWRALKPKPASQTGTGK